VTNPYIPFERQYDFPGEWANDLAAIMLTTQDPTGALSMEMLMNTIDRNEINGMAQAMNGMGGTLYDEE
jgi:hypothetical protein